MGVNRYHRQMLLDGIGTEGQAALGASTVAIVGCGALGCGTADHLARAGVGTMRIIDRDIVEETNLQRQTLFTQHDADEGRPKAIAAADRLGAINPDIEIEPIIDDFRASNAMSLLDGADLVVDGLDNLDARYLINDLCVRDGRPWVYAGAVATGGLVMPILPRVETFAGRVRWTPAQAGPCLRCLFPEPAPPATLPTCDTAGVLGPAVGAVTACQAAHAIRLLTGRIDGMDRSLHSMDLWTGHEHRAHPDAPSPSCPCCGEGVFEWADGSRGGGAEVLCGRNAVQVLPANDAPVDLETLKERLVAHGDVRCDGHTLRVTLTEPGVTMTIFADGRALVGVETPDQARTLYDRLVGS